MQHDRHEQRGDARGGARRAPDAHHLDARAQPHPREWRGGDRAHAPPQCDHDPIDGLHRRRRRCLRGAAAAVAARAALTDVSLCGRRSRGVVALAEAIETAGPSGHQRALNLSANCSPDAGRRITPDAIVRLAAALPCGVLRRLDLAGCNVSAHAVGMLAASLPRCALAALDLSSNHFGCEGAWSLAWAIADAPSLRTLNLSDCAIGDDGGEELADALCTPVAAASIQSIDLRGNKLAKDHRLGDDQRVGMGFQRPAAAAAAAEPEEAS